MNQYLSEDDSVSEDRKAFLDAAFEKHLGAEAARDIPGAVDTFAEGGHLDFNGEVYDTPEELLTFHNCLGFGGLESGLIRNFGFDRITKNYSQDWITVEYDSVGEVNVSFGGEPAGRTAHWKVAVVYQFDDEGMLVSERICFDSGGLLPEPVIPEFTADHSGS